MAHLSVHFAQDEEEQPLYCSPARIVFKPGQLSVQKASYVKRVIVRCIRHLPVPYIIEIPKEAIVGSKLVLPAELTQMTGKWV